MYCDNAVGLGIERFVSLDQFSGTMATSWVPLMLAPPQERGGSGSLSPEGASAVLHVQPTQINMEIGAEPLSISRLSALDSTLLCVNQVIDTRHSSLHRGYYALVKLLKLGKPAQMSCNSCHSSHWFLPVAL